MLVSLSHFPVTQSESSSQLGVQEPVSQMPQRWSHVVPPQSTPVSVPSLIPLLQDVHTEFSH